MRKFTIRAFMFISSLVAGVALTWLVAPSLFISPLDGGPLDYKPRLEASAESPDHRLSVRVYRQRPDYSLVLTGAVVTVKVYDKDGSVIYEQAIMNDATWSELDARYMVTFDRDRINIIGVNCRAGCPDPIHIIRMAELPVM
jgi:hypothetical protein